MFSLGFARSRAAGASTIILSLTTLIMTFSVAGCAVDENDPDLWNAISGIGGGGGMGGATSQSSAGGAGVGTGATSSNVASSSANSTSSSGTGMMDSGACTFTYDVTTTTYGGHYSPREVGAIWITDANGKFVKTLERWGTTRIKNAVHWEKSSGGNVVDAITGATELFPKTHQLSWDCKVAGAAVPDGDYFLNEEYTEDNSASNAQTPSRFVQVPFKKSAMPMNANPSDASGFTGQTLSFK